MSNLFLIIKARGYNDYLYWRGGSGNISDGSHWYINDGYSSCDCSPQNTLDSLYTITFGPDAGNGTVYLDKNISTGTVYLINTNIKIVWLNNTQWAIYTVGPLISVLSNPPFDAFSTIVAAFYILAFIAGAVLFIMFCFWVRRVRGKYL
jgi:hypothetical protein